MMRNLVYNSQDDLDELLGILGARVQKVCNEETELAQKASQEKLSPVDALRREKLINEINRYRTFYQNIVRYARIFNLIVSERWSAYFPERNKAA